MRDHHDPPRVTAAAVVPGSGLRQQASGFLQILLPALFIALVVQLFIVQAMRVQGSSMAPSLYAGQRVVVEKVT